MSLHFSICITELSRATTLPHNCSSKVVPRQEVIMAQKSIDTTNAKYPLCIFFVNRATKNLCNALNNLALVDFLKTIFWDFSSIVKILKLSLRSSHCRIPSLSLTQSKIHKTRNLQSHFYWNNELRCIFGSLQRCRFQLSPVRICPLSLRNLRQ